MQRFTSTGGPGRRGALLALLGLLAGPVSGHAGVEIILSSNSYVCAGQDFGLSMAGTLISGQSATCDPVYLPETRLRLEVGRAYPVSVTGQPCGINSRSRVATCFIRMGWPARKFLSKRHAERRLTGEGSLAS